ncbi:MAG: CoA-binding protein [Rhodospirillales bacterium]
MSDLVYSDDHIRRILKDTRTIAMAGASPNWVRPSNFAMKYLNGKGYQVHPINPGHAGKEIWGRMTYGALADVPGPIDMLDIFRNSEAAGHLVDEAIALKDEKDIKIIWMQLGVINEDAAKRAEDAGLTVVMDRCPKIEYGRLFGELGWSGVNSGIITSKRRKAPA